MITSDLTTAGKNLFARYAERMMVETSWTPTLAGSTSTRRPAASRSTSTWTPRSPSSPGTCAGCSPESCPPR
jgi:hypothetical protein